MAYEPPKYPGVIPTAEDLPDRTDDIDWLYAARYNELKKELRACLTELGTDPAGAYTTVKARLAVLALKEITELNMMLNAFRIAINGSLVKHNMVDGIMDEFEDESGIDTGASANEDYDAVNDLYEPASGEQLLDSYSESNWTHSVAVCSAAGFNKAIAQAITLPSDAEITSCKWYLKKTGSPTGNAYAKLYAVSGTVGSTGIPTGGVLATSSPVDVSGFGGSEALITFTFPTPYSASAGDVAVVIEYDGGDSSNTIGVGFDVSGGHAGNMVYYVNDTSTWSPNAARDCIFYLYETAATNMTLISLASTADAEPDAARIVLFEEDVDAIAENTDLKAWVSRDNGVTYTQVTLTDEGDYGSSKRILTGTVDISGQPGGTDMRWKATTHNTKLLKLHGVGVLWN